MEYLGFKNNLYFNKANCTVTYLQRIEFGPLKLNDLPLGEFRALTQEELDALKS